jgi:hypothetical protein
MSEVGPQSYRIISTCINQFRYGSKFVKRCKNYLHAKEEAGELLIAIESNWIKMETQIGIVKRIAPNLKKDLQDIQSRVLSQLEGKLKTASLVVEQLMSEQREVKKEMRKHDDREIGTALKGFAEMKISKRVLYTVKKDALYAVIDDIEKWQARYDPTWILIMQMSIGSINNQLDQKQKSPDVKDTFFPIEYYKIKF